MGCNNSVTFTCGATIPDQCILFTGTLPTCIVSTTCVDRVSQVLTLYGNQICANTTAIDISKVTSGGCITIANPTSIASTIQQLYNENCSRITDIATINTFLTNALSIPINQSQLNLSCLGANSCNPFNNYSNLGLLLEGILAKLCTCCSNS